MLNKKAQVEDNIEFVLCILGLIICVVVLTLLKADYAWSIDHAKNAWRAGTEIPPFDTQFMGTDLLNTAKIPIGGYTFGELITYMPRNYQGIKDPQFETLFWDQWFVDALACDEELYTVLNDYLSPVYEKYLDAIPLVSSMVLALSKQT